MHVLLKNLIRSFMLTAHCLNNDKSSRVQKHEKRGKAFEKTSRLLCLTTCSWIMRLNNYLPKSLMKLRDSALNETDDGK